MIKHRLLMVKLVLGLLLVPLLSLPAQAEKQVLTGDEIRALLLKKVQELKHAPNQVEAKKIISDLDKDQSLALIKNLTEAQMPTLLNKPANQQFTADRANNILENLDPTRALALVQNQTSNSGSGGGIAAPGTIEPGNDLWPTVNKLINLVRSYLIPLAILIIIYAGILYETSAMNPALQGTAKTILWTTISGLIFLILYPTLVGILSDNGLIPPTEIDSSSGGVVVPT